MGKSRNQKGAKQVRTQPNDVVAALRQGVTLKEYLRQKPIQDLISQYQTAQDKANSANELRYQQGLGVHNDIIKAFSDINVPTVNVPGSFGAGERQRIDRSRRQSIASGQQSLVNSGLLNTTITPTVTTLANQRASEQTGNLNDRIYNMQRQEDILRYNRQRQNTGDVAQAYGAKAGFIERKNDVSPNFDLLGTQINMASRGPLKLGKFNEKYRKRMLGQLNSAGYTGDFLKGT